MNIVQTILNLLSGNLMDKLSSLIGESESTTESAVSAAVPSLLSALSGLASTEQGAQKLAGAMGKLDPGSISNLGNLLTAGSPASVAEQGGSLLASLLGGNAVTGLTSALARYTGLGGGAAKGLLSYLGPLVLGAIAKQFVGKALNAQTLMNLFSSQKANIVNAIPSGLSLADIPGLEPARTAVHTAYGPYGAGKHAAAAPARSILPWVLGAAALAALLYILWPKAQLPEVAQLTKDVNGTFTSLTSTLSGIKDVASAEAAMPALTELSSKLNGMQAAMDKLPATARSAVTELIKPGLEKLRDQFNRVLMIPGVAGSIRPSIEGIVGKLTNLGGLKPGDFALPSPQVTGIGSSLSALVASLNETLGGVKDPASADAALPKLKELNSQLDSTLGDLDRLPSASKATIGSVLKSALQSLTALVSRVLSIAGIGDQVKPVADDIARKLATIGS
jgi:hypothetical protein